MCREEEAFRERVATWHRLTPAVRDKIMDAARVNIQTRVGCRVLRGHLRNTNNCRSMIAYGVPGIPTRSWTPTRSESRQDMQCVARPGRAGPASAN